MRGLLILPLAATLGGFLFLYSGRGYPWQLALLAATAIGALIYAGRHTLHNLRLLSRADRSPTVTWIAEGSEEGRERWAPLVTSGGAPREEDQRRGEQQVDGAAQSPPGQ